MTNSSIDCLIFDAMKRDHSILISSYSIVIQDIVEEYGNRKNKNRIKEFDIMKKVLFDRLSYYQIENMTLEEQEAFARFHNIKIEYEK